MAGLGTFYFHRSSTRKETKIIGINPSPPLGVNVVSAAADIMFGDVVVPDLVVTGVVVASNLIRVTVQDVSSINGKPYHLVCASTWDDGEVDVQSIIIVPQQA